MWVRSVLVFGAAVAMRKSSNHCGLLLDYSLHQGVWAAYISKLYKAVVGFYFSDSFPNELAQQFRDVFMPEQGLFEPSPASVFEEDFNFCEKFIKAAASKGILFDFFPDTSLTLETGLGGKDRIKLQSFAQPTRAPWIHFDFVDSLMGNVCAEVQEEFRMWFAASPTAPCSCSNAGVGETQKAGQVIEICFRKHRSTEPKEQPLAEQLPVKTGGA